MKNKVFLLALLSALILCSCSAADTDASPSPDQSNIESTESIENSDNYEESDTSTGNGESYDTTPDFTEITNEKDNYTMQIKRNDDGTYTVIYTPKAQDRTDADMTQPFLNVFDTAEISFTLDPKSSVTERTEISYSKREGGNWIYSNNPEMLAPEDIGQALLRTEKMQGAYTFTFEHSNRTGEIGYFGYQLKNTGDTDVTVTVTNIGLQVDGEWLGQRSWSDYFGVEFKLPDDYFLSDGKLNPAYVGCDYVKYTPEKSVKETYTVPAGEYIYVLGGTTSDAYDGINVGGTADKKIYKGKCVNGAVKFDIEGGEMQGTFYFYTDPSQVKAEPDEQGYIVWRNGTDYSAQYKGVDHHQGLIESNPIFVVTDSTKNGKLPVKYQKESDISYSSKNTPYAEYDMKSSTVYGTSWVTSLNPNTSDRAIGTDMMTFECVTTDGKIVNIDNNHADGDGDPANTGNWMIQYTDNMTFINAGSKARTFKVYKRGATAGALAIIIRDYNGKVLDSMFKTQPYSFGSLDEVFAGVDKNNLILKNGRYWFKTLDGRTFCDVHDERSLCYTVTVEPYSAEQISIDYLILGNSNGGITHWVEVEDAE